MSERMSHEEYVLSARARAVDACAAILAGKLDVLEGCHLLASLRWEVEVDERDADFVTFAVISSEVDALPIGEVRQHWAPEALAKFDPDIRSATAWALPQAVVACRSVIQRFEVVEPNLHRDSA